MTELQTLELARPEVEPLSDADRASLRAEVFGSTLAHLHLDPGPADEHQIQIDMISGTDRMRPRSSRSRRAVSIAAALLVTAGLSGVWIASTARGPHDDPAEAEEQGPTAAPATTVDTVTATTAMSVSTTPAIAGTALAVALEPDSTVLVVNASQTDGIAMSLSNALEQSGYDVVPPTNATGAVSLSQSAIYFHLDKDLAAFNAITNAVPIPLGENLDGQSIPGLDDAMLASADIIVVLGDDLAGAPWETRGTPFIDQGIGTLLVLDATTTAAGHDRAEQLAQQLRTDGVDVGGVVKATRPVEVSMLMPTGESTPWAFAVAALAGISGFDTLDATLMTDPLPANVAAVLVIAEQ